jgi:hypothetical protein
MAVPASARVGYSRLPPAIGADGRPISTEESNKLQRSLETLFPDMLLHGAHSTLLGMTTSLTKVSSQTHQYFSRVTQILAFDRMMRNFMRMTAAMLPFPVEFGAAQYWANILAPQPQAPSPWAFPVQQPHPAHVLPFFANVFQPQPAPPSRNAAMPFFGNAFQPQPALPGHNAAMPFFANVFQPQPPAPSKASPWPDYSELMIVPMALLMAAPRVDQMWGGRF